MCVVCKGYIISKDGYKNTQDDLLPTTDEMEDAIREHLNIVKCFDDEEIWFEQNGVQITKKYQISKFDYATFVTGLFTTVIPTIIFTQKRLKIKFK